MSDCDELRRSLATLTPARLVLGRAGSSLPTRAWLDFQLAHARARDAVHTAWDADAFAQKLAEHGLESLRLRSLVPDRRTYLTRPDLGRLPDPASLDRVRALPPADVALVVSDGLSATGLAHHGVPLVRALHRALSGAGLSLTPALLVPSARVALGDPVGEAARARLSLVVIGERPGLSADDSLGLYLTHAPRPGLTDAARNCISNVRPPTGLGHDEAAALVTRLATAALRRGLTGVDLKDDEPALLLTPPDKP